MDKQCSVNTIAEAVILWENEIVTDYYFQDKSYDGQIYECFNILVTTVSNFLNVFEIEFEQIFSVHCYANMSEEQFLNFVDPRITLLGQLKGYFGCIMPCAFVREIIYRFRITFECYHFVALARKCLVKFLESKFKESEKDNNWLCLLSYCVDINSKFRRFHSQNERCIFDFKQETEHTELNLRTVVLGQTGELFNCDETVINTKVKLDSAIACMKDTIAESGRMNWESNSIEKHSDENFVSRMNSNEIFDLSKAISEISLEVEKEQREAGEHHIIGDVNHSKSTSVTSRIIETCLGIDDELNEMCDILMPDLEFRDEVFDLIEKCDFLDRPDDKVINLKGCKRILSHI